VPTDGIQPEAVALRVLEIIENGHYEGIHLLAFRDFNQDLLHKHDLQQLIEKEVLEGRVTVDSIPKSLAD